MRLFTCAIKPGSCSTSTSARRVAPSIQYATRRSTPGSSKAVPVCRDAQAANPRDAPRPAPVPAARHTQEKMLRRPQALQLRDPTVMRNSAASDAGSRDGSMRPRRSPVQNACLPAPPPVLDPLESWGFSRVRWLPVVAAAKSTSAGLVSESSRRPPPPDRRLRPTHRCEPHRRRPWISRLTRSSRCRCGRIVAARSRHRRCRGRGRP